VSIDDLSFFELKDKVMIALGGFHGLLPEVNLVQRLTVKHLRKQYSGKVWGRRFPGADSWKPPITGLKERDRPKV
jgi:hypothetical protein